MSRAVKRDRSDCPPDFADMLTLFQSGGGDYAHLINNPPP